jgi:hypothetical protein
MVRAAASGAIDYSRADPKDINWRIRHRLVIREMQRRNDEELFTAVHRHWLSYISHGRLEPESFENICKRSDTALLDLQRVIYPWAEVEKPKEGQEEQKDTINPETRKLLDGYKRAQERLKRLNEEAQENA